jgi:hypothetical protein
LAGWLYRHSHLKALEAVRAEGRRRLREEKACLIDTPAHEPAWQSILPLLDQAMQRLNPAERDAIVLRFFENYDLRTVGKSLGLSEDAAQKKVSRALEKLQSILSRQGVDSPTKALASCLAFQWSKPVSVALINSICAAAAPLHTSALTTYILPFMASAKIKLGVAATLTATLVTTTVLQHQADRRLRAENLALQDHLAQTEESLAAQSAAAQSRSSELKRLRTDNADLLRLRNQVDQLKRERDKLLAASSTRGNQPALPTPSPAWVEQMLKAPLDQQGSAAGALRAKLLRGNQASPPAASELALREALLQQDLNQKLEQSPKDFADFQAAFIQATLEISDTSKVQQIHQLVLGTYQTAVAEHLDIPSKPAADTETWVMRRHQLDRQATATLKQLLTAQEAQLFDRAFLGVMGIDLGGVGVDKSNYPPGFLGDSR